MALSEENRQKLERLKKLLAPEVFKAKMEFRDSLLSDSIFDKIDFEDSVNIVQNHLCSLENAIEKRKLLDFEALKQSHKSIDVSIALAVAYFNKLLFDNNWIENDKAYSKIKKVKQGADLLMVVAITSKNITTGNNIENSQYDLSLLKTQISKLIAIISPLVKPIPAF